MELLQLVQKRIASTSVGSSTVRNMFQKGTSNNERPIDQIRRFLAELEIKDFAKVKNQSSFDKLLDKKTEELKDKYELRWGTCRKCINIFLRGVFYHYYLRKEYSLDHLEPWLEIPLDSHVAKGLKKEKGANSYFKEKGILKWPGVINLEEESSKLYQEFAKHVAETKGTYRVHLDLCYWRAETSGPELPCK